MNKETERKEISKEELKEAIWDVLEEQGIIDKILAQIPMKLETEKKEEREGKITKSEIRKKLIELGLPIHLNGFSYIEEVTYLMIQNPNLKITKDIYPMIAQKHGVKKQQVDRNIRKAVDSMYVRTGGQPYWDVFERQIPKDAETLTNLQFLKLLAECLLLE